MAESRKRGGSPVDVARYLSGIDFPVTRDELIRHAQRQDADEGVLELLGHLPNRDYGSMADVMKGVGQAQ